MSDFRTTLPFIKCDDLKINGQEWPSQYGVDNYAAWRKALKKVHGDKTMETSTNNAFGYRPIYKRIVSTK